MTTAVRVLIEGRVQGVGFRYWMIERAGGGSATTQSGDFTGRFGGGIDFYITKNWVIEGTGTYVVPTGAQNEQRYWSLGAGLQYRFDPYVY